MVVTSYTQELACPAAPGRMFEALILDSRTLMPKLLPQLIKSVDCSDFNFVKHRIDEVDENSYVCKYTMVEGDALGDKLEYIAYEIKFEHGSNGGCICKMTSNYHGTGGFEVKEDEIKAGKDSAMAIYKVVEAYLLGNPQVYVSIT